jgi:hypothetical protein
MTLGVLLGFSFLGALSSQSLMDLFMALSCFWGLYVFFKEEDSRSRKQYLIEFFKSTFFRVFLFWWVVVISGFIFAPIREVDYSLTRILEFRWIFFLFFAIYFFRKFRIQEKYFFYLNFALVFFAAYACGLYFLGYDPLKSDGENTLIAAAGISRTGGLVGNSMTYAHMYGPVGLVLLGLFTSNSKYRHWFLLGGALVLASVLLTFTRGVWVGALVGALLIGFAYQVRWGVGFTGLLAVLFVSLFFAWRDFQTRILYVFDSTSYDATRLWLWKANLEVFKDHPIVGAGYGINSKILPTYFEKLGAPADTLVSHAHNQFLHLLAGTGILGLVCYLSLHALSFMQAYRLLKVPKVSAFEKSLLLGVLGALVAFNVGSLTESNFEHSKVRTICLLFWALCWGLHFKHFVKPQSSS